MRVLMLGWELPPHNSGGLGVACYNLCKSLSKRNVDIEFVLPYHADHDINFMNISAASPQDIECINRSGIAYDSSKYCYRKRSYRDLSIIDQQAIYEEAVGQIVRRRNFDIIHAHDWLTFRAALYAKNLKGTPVVAHAHSIESDRAGGTGGNPLVREIEEIAFLSSDRIIAVSDFTRQAISRDYNIPITRIDVVHNSIESSDIVPIETDVPTTYRYLAAMKCQGYRVVANVGRLTIQKGIPNLLRAAQLVVEYNPKTIFLIVGSGEQFRELVELAAELGIAKNVIFTDFQRGKAWRDAFAIADLFVMPSISEPFGLTPLEAIGYGTPSLISKQSGVSEILKHVLKVDYWDITEMANQIISVTLNDPLRDELVEGASRELSELSWGKAADEVWDIYSQQVRVGSGA